MENRIRPVGPSSPADGKMTFAALERAQIQGAAGLRLFLAWQIVRTALRLGAAGCMALLFGRLVMGQEMAPWSLAAVLVLVCLAAWAGLMADHAQAGAETRVSIAIRQAASERLQGLPAGLLRSLPAGALSVAVQRYPEAVSSLVIGHRAAGMMMAVGPLMAAMALAAVSWQSALLVLLLTPVMILFFVLVGGAIRERADAQERAFGHLAGQFADRIRTLPTIVANDALASEEAKLSGRLDVHVARTMGVLRLAFLNAGLIDFFASLSIAMLAVFLGLGHLGLATLPGFSGLELWQSLFVLMVAPEYFAPFRRFSEQYHAKAEGQAAAAALDRLLDTAAPAMPCLPAVDEALSKMELPSHGLVVVTGPSGAGKSTLLRRLVGIERAPRDGAAALPGGCVWVATDSFVAGGSLAEAMTAGLPAPDAARLHQAAARIGLLDDVLLPGGLSARIATGGANLSGGQRLRIAVARALLSDGTVVADEPTAKLDPRTAQAVRLALRDVAQRRLVVVASHDPALVALADRRVDLSLARMPETVA